MQQLADVTREGRSMTLDVLASVDARLPEADSMIAEFNSSGGKS